jgi:hypothetical protein
LTIGDGTATSSIWFDGNSTSFDLLKVTGALTVSGTTLININALASLSAGTYNLITFTSASGANYFTLGSTSTSVGNKSLSLASTGTSEQLIVTAASVNYWNGGSVWNNSANWTVDITGTTAAATIPTTASDVYFSTNNVSNSGTISLGQSFVINSLNFNSNATGAILISDTANTLQIEAGGIKLDAGTGAHTLSVNGLKVDNNQPWINNSSSPFTVTSGIAGTAASGTTVLTLTGTSGGFVLSGPLSDGAGGGALGLVVNGAGQVVTLTGSNTLDYSHHRHTELG